MDFAEELKLGETEEYLGNRSVGSSTMPQKKNPRGPGDLIEFSRVIPRLSEIVLDDMINSFERDGQKSDEIGYFTQGFLFFFTRPFMFT